MVDRWEHSGAPNDPPSSFRGPSAKLPISRVRLPATELHLQNGRRSQCELRLRTLGITGHAITLGPQADEEVVRVVLRMVVGLVLTAVAFAIAGRRAWWLKRLALTGQPAPERLEYAKT